MTLGKLFKLPETFSPLIVFETLIFKKNDYEVNVLTSIFHNKPFY